MRKIFIPTTVAAVIAAGLVGIPTEGANASGSTGVHCYVVLPSIGSPGVVAAPKCFSTTTEMEVSATGGDVGHVTTKSTTTSTVKIGVAYQDINEGGDSLTFYGSSTCSGVTFGFGSISSDWASNISSVRAANGCWVTLYTEKNYGGDRLNCTPYCSSISTWNDDVKSLVFRPKGQLG